MGIERSQNGQIFEASDATQRNVSEFHSYPPLLHGDEIHDGLGERLSLTLVCRTAEKRNKRKVLSVDVDPLVPARHANREAASDRSNGNVIRRQSWQRCHAHA